MDKGNHQKSEGAYALLITSDRKVILQQRTDDPVIENSGKIGMFGGGLEEGENVQDGLKRELSEELELNVDDFEVKKLNAYNKKNEKDGLRHVVNVHVIEGIDRGGLKLKEGKEFVVDDPGALLKNNNLTVVTRLAIRDLINQKQ